jgi:CHAT domain-containing protein
LRINADSRYGRQPFVGFGDPKLTGPAGSDTRGLGFDIVAQSVTEVDPKKLQGKMAALPESSQELHAMAKLLGADDDNVYLGERASETLVKGMNLAAFRTVAFATHALMTGEFRGLAEPALVMTPPANASAEDDGLLTASEVAQLKLDADWVVLSACNTASPAGRPGAEGLSGLAKAFFYAGSRSLLVSHWWVVSDSTVLLTTGAVETLRNNPGMRRAEALQIAMLGLMDGKADPNYAHPVFWAPFVLVGEGGPMRLE